MRTTRDITPQSVRGGTYRFNTNVVGVTPGSFTLQATVMSSTCTDYYLACSAAARAQELECFAEYVGCYRKKLFGL